MAVVEEEIGNWLAPRPTEVPDEDTASASSVSSEEEASLVVEPQLCRTTVSNLFFLIGSAFYVVVGIWDIVDLDDDDDDDGLFWDLYRVFSVLAASSYVFDSILSQLSSRFRCDTELAVVLSFGCAALLDLKSSLATRQRLENEYAMAAAHAYLVNALLAVLSREKYSHRLEQLGDYLFLIGSVLDVVISWFYESIHKNLVAYGNLLSTLLWLVDAVLYIAADCLLYGTMEQEEDDTQSQVETEHLMPPEQNELIIDTSAIGND